MTNLVVSMDSEGWYSFVSRGTRYDLKEETQWGHWLVWTWRQSLPKTCRTVRTFTLDEMKNGSNKTLKAFADLVAVEAGNKSLV